MFNKKFLISFAVLFSLFFASIPTVTDAVFHGLVPCGHNAISSEGAASPPPLDSPNYYGRCTICDLFILANKVMTQLRNWIFITAVVIIAIAGVMYIVSVGNESMTSMAKTAIKAALIGAVIILVAWLAISSLLLAMAVKDDAVSEDGVGLILERGDGNVITGWQFNCGNGGGDAEE